MKNKILLRPVLSVCLAVAMVMMAVGSGFAQTPTIKQTVKQVLLRSVHIIPDCVPPEFNCKDDDNAYLFHSEYELKKLNVRATVPLIEKYDITRMMRILRRQPILKVHIHAIRTANDAGTDAAIIKPEEVKAFVDQANKVYWPSGIEFVFDPTKDFEHRNSTLLNQDCSLANISQHMSDPNWDPSTLDKTKNQEERTKVALQYRGKLVVFFRYGTKFVWDEDLKEWKVGPATGGFSASDAEFVAMPRKYGEKNLLAHEIGHYLHCPHTHVGGIKTVEDAAAAIKNWVEKQGHRTQDGLSVFDGDSKVRIPTYPYPVEDTPPDAEGSIFVSKYGEGGRCGPTGSIQIPVIFSNGYQAYYTLKPDRLDIMSYFKGCYNLGTHHLSNEQIANARDAIQNGNRKHLLNP
jgi:hypothetical protein